MKIMVKDKSSIMELMIKKGFTQRSFGRTANISSPYISQVINGDRNPGPEIAKRICDNLGVTFDDIFFIDSAYKSDQTA